MHPISSRDFATAVADYVEDCACANKELLVGGPNQVRWRELGLLIAKIRPVRLLTLPLKLFKPLLIFVSILSIITPSLKGLALSMRLLMIPMTTNTSNDDFICVGSDTVEDLLNDHLNREQTIDGWVHRKVFSKTKRNEASTNTIPSPKHLSNIVWIVAMCDGLTALCNPSFQSKMMSLNLESINGILVRSFGIVSIGIATTVFSSLHLINDDRRPRVENVVWAGLLFDFASVIAMTTGKYNAIMSLIACILVRQLLALDDRMYFQGILSLLLTSFGLVNYFDPSMTLLALFGTDVDTKTQQHMRQIAIWYIGSGLHKIALLTGLKSDKAAGMICLVWSIFSIEQWRVVDMVKVFQMSSFSKSVNATFPIWSGILALLILCGYQT
jgi:hypothetical protein